MGKRAAIVGTGQTYHKSIRRDVNGQELINEAVTRALEDEGYPLLEGSELASMDDSQYRYILRGHDPAGGDRVSIPLEDERLAIWHEVGPVLVSEFGGEWELYDLSVDRGEMKNLVGSKPEVAAKLAAEWEEYATEIGVVDWGSLPQSKSSPGPDYRKK